MSDSENEDETKSETSDISDYPDIDIEEQFEEIVNYQDFLIEKYRLIFSFMDGLIQPNNYEITMSRINRDLRESIYNERTVDKNILDKESELNTQLEMFEGKIKNYIEATLVPRKEYAFRSELVKDLFSSLEIENLKVLRYQLAELIELNNPQDEDGSFKLKGLWDEWNVMTPEQKAKIEMLTHLSYPIENNFTSRQDFQRAKEDFLMDISIFLNSYWNEYEKKEESELLTLAKKAGFIAPPKKDKSYDAFLKKMTKYLEYGYIYKINATKLGGIYEKINKPSMRTQLQELTKRQRELPIRLKQETEMFAEKMKIYKELLKEVSKEHLIQCIFGTSRFKNTVSYTYNKPPKEQISQVVKERSKYNKPKELIYGNIGLDEMNTRLVALNALLDQLQKQQRSFESKNLFSPTISDKKIQALTIPSNTSPEDKIKINKLIQQITKSKINLILRQGYVNKLRELYKKYNIDTSPEDKQKQIKTITEDKFKLIQAINLKRQDPKTEVTEKEYGSEQSNVDVKHYPKLLDKIKMGQLIYSVRRKLLPSSLNYLVELYDINELTNKSRVKYASKRQKIIPSSIYIKIKRYLVDRIRSIDPEFKTKFKQTLVQAVNLISQATGIILPKTTNITNLIKIFRQKWKNVWEGEIIKDVYGKNVFETLFYSTTPFDFYSPHSNRAYSEMVRQFTPLKQPVYTRAQAMHDNLWYNVQFLDKNPVTGQPSLIYKSELELNPKTKRHEVVNKISVRNGITPYIKILLRTDQAGETKEIWKEVRAGEIKKRILS